MKADNKRKKEKQLWPAAHEVFTMVLLLFYAIRPSMPFTIVTVGWLIYSLMFCRMLQAEQLKEMINSGKGILGKRRGADQPQLPSSGEGE